MKKIIRAHELTMTDSYLGSFSRLKTWGFWRNMLVYFCVFSVVGHLLEWIYCAFGATFFNSISWEAEVLTNPAKPFFIYGIGIILCAIFLAPLKDVFIRKCPKVWQAVLIFYVISVFLGMGMELAQGFAQNQPVDGVYPLWDVHDYPGNILGQAWIVNDIFLGLVFTFATWHIFPLCEYRMAQMTEPQANRNVAIICIACVIITFFTYVVFV